MSGWACEACTFVNPSGLTCGVCGTESAKQKKLFEQSGWTCASCTFGNRKEVEDCEMCGQTNVKLQQERLAKEKEAKRKQKELEELKKKQIADAKKKADEMDTKMASVCVAQYPTAYLQLRALEKSGKTVPTEKDARTLLNTLYECVHFVESTEKPMGVTQCSVCYSDFDDETKAVVCKNCGHNEICQSCFSRFLQVRIRDEEVLPWIPCPSVDCGIPCHPQNLIECKLSVLELYQMICVIMKKTLARNKDWISCPTDKCEMGFVIKQAGKVKQKCPACLKTHTLEKRDADEDFKKLISTGVVRLCPKCEHPAMKDFGMCNIMECSKCGIWWNWRTRESGKTSRDLKDKARSMGTLWEPGELAFQQKLQRENPKAFKELLEKNGIKYDPNYVRGAG